MSEGTKTYQVFKIAKELNIAAERIIEFINKETKVAVKSPASKVDEDIYKLILDKFKKEKQSEEIRQKKLEAFKSKVDEQKKEKVEKPKRREKKLVDVIGKDTEPVATAVEETEEPVLAEKIFKEAPVTSEVISQDIEVVEQSAEKIIEEIEEKSLVEVTETLPETLDVTEDLPTTDIQNIEQTRTTERAKTTLDEIKEKVKGIKVLGKIDLEKTEELSEEISEEEIAEKVKVKVSIQEEEETEKKKKKKPKKKQLRELIKKKQVQQEELVKVKKVKKSKLKEFDEKEIETTIRRTLESMDESALSVRASLRKKKKKEKLEELKKQEELLEQEKSTLRVSEFITVGELSNLLNVSSSDIIKNLFGYGIMASINQRLEKDIIQIVADNFGYNVKYFRPPHGKFQLTTNSLLKKFGLKNVMWSLLTYDYKNNLEVVKFAVKNYLSSNSIVVLHDSMKSKDIIIDSIKVLNEEASNRNFSFGDPTECLN